MISIFNGRKRRLGSGGSSVTFAQIDVTFRDRLAEFRGPKLAIFMAIALHADEDGLAWPSYDTLSKETGYGKDAIGKALRELCGLEIDGARVLARIQRRGENEQFTSNMYLIFPSPDEIAELEAVSPHAVSPYTVSPDTVTADTNKNQPHEEEPCHGHDGPTDNHVCEVHGVVMKRREKDGKAWYSHRLPGGSWCSGIARVPGLESFTCKKCYRVLPKSWEREGGVCVECLEVRPSTVG